MLKNMRLKTKIFFLVNGVVMGSFLLVIYIVSKKSIEMAKASMYQTTLETADKYSNEIKAELQGARTTSETLASVFEVLREDGFTDRKMMDDIIKHTLAKKEYITAFCVGYEPNALDGKDDEYKNVKPQNDETGRYIPYWNKLNGNIAVEPLLDYTTADWYSVPRNTKKEYITDPYPYKVQGKDVMLASFIFPVLYQGEFIAITSSDIVLDKLQEMVSKVRPYGTGYTSIISNSGDIVAHPDKDMLGKKLDNEMAKEAVKGGRQYIDSNKNFYTVYMPIRFSEDTKPWSVAVSVPMNKVLENAVQIRNYVVIVASIALILIGFILYLITRSVTKPILRLSNTAKDLGEGKFDTEIEVIESNDEMGALSRAFKFMASKINEQIGQMQKYAVELEEKNKYLNNLNKLKDEFLANTSHELRTPLNGIIGIVESMMDGATGQITKEQRYNLALVDASGKRLLHLINDILDFTKLKNKEIELQLKTVDLKTTVDTILILSKQLAKSREIALLNEVSDAIPLLRADENRLQQVLYNLVGNAIKFTEKGKVIVSAKLKNDFVEISVSDTGIGIPSGKFDSIFESFEQADGSISREYGGTGLGLSITKKLIELHGGAIRVESEPGRGSKFTFSMPASSQIKSEVKEAAKVMPMIGMEDSEEELMMDSKSEMAEVTGADDRRYKVLIVDDEPINIQVLTNILSSKEYALTRAYNGLEALERIQSGGKKYDLVLLDLMLPKMSGYEVCEHIRKQFSLLEIPVLMLTAKNQIEDIVLGFQAGANDYVPKPFEKQELLARANTLMSLKQAVREIEDYNRTLEQRVEERTRELKEAQDQLVQAAKMASIGTLAGGVAHEINNPLGAIVANTQMLLMDVKDESQKQSLQLIEEASKRCRDIVLTLLKYSRKPADNELNLVKLNDVIADTCHLISNQLEQENVHVSMEYGEIAAIKGNANELSQVFMNVILNARNAIKKTKDSGHIHIKTFQKEDAVIVQVTDDGCGISKENLSRIFDPFFTTMDVGKGTGLGLSISQKIVEKHNGHIEVNSKEGEGAAFVMKFFKRRETDHG